MPGNGERPFAEMEMQVKIQQLEHSYQLKRYVLFTSMLVSSVSLAFSFVSLFDPDKEHIPAASLATSSVSFLLSTFGAFKKSCCQRPRRIMPVEPEEERESTPRGPEAV